MLSSRELPTIEDLRLFLSLEGFEEQPPGPAGSLWTRDDVTLAVPAVDDPAVTAPLVGHLSELSRLRSVEMCRIIKYYAYDMADFRAASDLLNEQDSIPLTAAETIIANIRYLLRSSGTTAFRNQADLKGHYSQYGREVMNAARMAHTKTGSFIIPVILRLPLDEVRAVDVQGHQGELITTGPAEPIERRVLRTLAQSLHAINEAIVRPAVDPTLENLHAVVDMGVSREMCLALAEMLEQPVVNELDTTFQWAPAMEPSKSTPRRISIPSDSRELIERAAAKLKNNQIEPSRTLSGAIIALRHEPNTDVGLVTISTARNGRPAEVTVRLSYDRYREALEWHAERRVLTVHGEVRGGRGQRLHIDDPLRCEPIEDLFSEMTRSPKSRLRIIATVGPDSVGSLEGRVLGSTPQLPPGDGGGELDTD